MGFFSILLVLLVAFGFSVIYRRYQIKAARLTRVDNLAASILAIDVEQANRQQLADVLKDWDSLTGTRAADIKEHLSKHHRLDGIDLSDPQARRGAYEMLVGISPGKSPEK